MHTTTTSTPLTPGVLSLLPLFYVGWSDSVLTPTEMDVIHKKIKQMGHLTEADKAYLTEHTDPRKPPSPALFKTWLDALRQASAQLPPDSKHNLAQLGIDIAKATAGPEGRQRLDDPQVLDALLHIEQELGVNTYEDLNGMIRQLAAPQLSVADKPGSFDSKKMQAILDGPTAPIKQAVRNLLKDPFFHVGIVRDKEEHRRRILEMVQALAQQGYGALPYPVAVGGKADTVGNIAAFQTFAYHDLSMTIKFGVQFGLFGGAILHLGSERHHRLYLPLVGSTELLGCFAMTETGHGSNVKELETTATYHHERRSIIVHTPHEGAGKEYIGNALHGSMAAVFAQFIVNGENHGIHAVLVPYRDANGALLPGITVRDCGYKVGLNGVDNGRLWFDQVEVPLENLLNRYGDVDANGQYTSPIENDNKRFFTMLGALVGGRICVGLAGVSAAKTALTVAVRYGLRRRQFAPKDGEPETLLLDYPSHQHRLTPLLVRAYAYHFALNNLGDRYAAASPDDMRQIETQAAGLKAMATWLCTQTVQECREACGGKGYLAENRFADLKADSDIFTTFEGDNTVLMQLVAKGLLTEFKQSFHDDGIWAVMRYMGGKISRTLTTYNPYFTGNTETEHLLDPQFHAEALLAREEKILVSLSDRMRNYLGKRLDPYEAFLKCQMHMIALAKAYIEHLTYQEMVASIEQAPLGAERDFLGKIAAYFALHCIHDDKGWYLEAEFMNAEKSKAIRALLNKMTQDLRPELEGMVAAFGIPDASLDAEILR
jgi:acyl-CoA oxidase